LRKVIIIFEQILLISNITDPFLRLLTGHHAMKAYGGVDEELHAFFDLSIRWRWMVSFIQR